MLFDLAEAGRVLRRSRRRAIAGLQPQGRRAAVREAARSRISLPDVHRSGAAHRRRRRRRRRAARHRTSRQGHADDGADGRTHLLRRRDADAADGQRGWHLRAAASRRREQGFYRVELDAAGRRKGRRVAAVHDRHPVRPGAVGDACRSRGATPMRRRSRSSSSRRARTTTSRCAICSSCTRSTAARRRRCGSSTAASRCRK